MLEHINNLDLLEVTSLIRDSFKENNLQTSNSSGKLTWQTNLRTSSIKTFTKTPSGEELPKIMNDMNKRFKEIMQIDESFDFIKAVADFHFDFLKIHPFTDGNGRTSRSLLILMLASKNILVPSLYLTSEQKDNFYFKSNKALNGDYSVIEKNY